MRKFFKPLFKELILFLFKYIRNVELLKLFVSKINKKLLEGVYQENLKPEDIQKPNASPAISRSSTLKINFLYLYFFIQL